MYLAKLFDEAHFAVETDADETVCEKPIHNDFLVKDIGFKNAVYYIEKFEQGAEMDICEKCADYIRDNHDLSDETYNEVAESAKNGA